MPHFLCVSVAQMFVWTIRIVHSHAAAAVVIAGAIYSRQVDTPVACEYGEKSAEWANEFVGVKLRLHAHGLCAVKFVYVVDWFMCCACGEICVLNCWLLFQNWCCCFRSLDVCLSSVNKLRILWPALVCFCVGF